MAGPQPLANILEITPYKGGQKLENAHKLSSNENPLGCSPKARDALIEASQHLELYPDGSAAALRGEDAQALGGGQTWDGCPDHWRSRKKRLVFGRLAFLRRPCALLISGEPHPKYFSDGFLTAAIALSAGLTLTPLTFPY